MLRHVREYFQLGDGWFRAPDAVDEGAYDLIVGIANTFHDGAIAILGADDEVFAESLERPCQLKRAMLVTSLHYAIGALKRSFLANVARSAASVRVLVRFTWQPTLGVRLLGGFYVWLLRLRSAFPLRVSPVELPVPIVYSTRLAQVWYWDTMLFPTYHFRHELFPRQRLRLRNALTDHHMTHAANAVYTSSFADCAVMVLDGQGEWASLSFYRYGAGRFERLSASRDSLGLLYADVTALCGFSPTEGEEWKVMGLAAYGEVDPRIVELFMAYTRIDGLRLRMRFDEAAVRRLRQLTGPFRSSDDPDVLRAAALAASFQAYFTAVVVRLAAAVHTATGAARLAYAGGCALNSATNGHLVGAATGFASMHVPCAPADDGNALGAALYERHVARGAPYAPRTMSPYLGSTVDDAELERLLAFGGLRGRRLADAAEVAEAVAELLAAGEIVGVMRGRAEFGPRALGNRSLLADPRRADMKQEINRLVKFREDYRPLAPAILHEHGSAWFEPYHESPYMERALPFRLDVRAQVPAVVHADGTGRLQSVSRALNPDFHDLISAFHRRTGVPLVVNTSLNVMGKPIVHGVKDAVQLLYTTGLRYLLIERYLLAK